MHFALPRVQRPDDETFSGTLSCLFLWFSILVFELRLELLLHHFVLIVGTDEDASTRLSSHVNDVLERISIKYNHSEYRKKFIVQVIPPKSVPAALSALQCSVKATVLLNASVDQLEQREYVELHQLFKCSTDAFSADQKMHCVVSNPVGVLCKTDFIKERDFTFEQVEAMICAKQHACSTQGTFTFLPLSPSPRVLEENCGAPAEFSTDIATHMHHYSSRALSDLILGDAIDCYCTLV
ncbi:hypothetical protein ADEAN_000834800 [Angomonas deanei]|uniref:Uncharacterized protein n=1 Tax=Angomonas deanei TaxID=59799 RepID=A0A7G2CN16_9TRYP|nr:hypothetical protein ADEAN_000834800 [Angomonas deanei]